MRNKAIRITALLLAVLSLAYAATTFGARTIPSSGTPVKVSDTSTTVQWLAVQAKCTNSGSIYIGGSDVSSTATEGKIELLPCGSFMFPPSARIEEPYNLNAIYVAAATSGDGFQYVYSK